LTSRQFEAIAAHHSIRMFSCQAGPETKMWDEDSITRYEWKWSEIAVNVEADLSLDLLFLRHRRDVRNALKRFDSDFVHVKSPGDCRFLGALLVWPGYSACT
jgi:hypothetical protein